MGKHSLDTIWRLKNRISVLEKLVEKLEQRIEWLENKNDCPKEYH